MFDFHAHCFPPALAQKAVDSVKNDNPHKLNGTLDDQLDFMKTHALSGCALLHMATRPQTMHKVNTFALSTFGPDRFVFGSIHPDAPDAFEELDWLWEHGFRAVKFHTSHQNFDFDDKKYLPLYRRIGQMKMVTLIHCGPSAKSNQHLVYPKTVANVIEAFNDAPFICAHMGGVGPEQADFDLLRQMPVYVDTALATRWMSPGMLAESAARLGSHRVLFGSDLPWASFEQMLELVRQAAALDPAIDLDAILEGNARRLIRSCEQMR